jgi:CDP-diacylglycerol--serine O-phosphatidyltransferase
MAWSSELFPPRSWVPCAITGANLAAGFVSMLLATTGRFPLAVYVLCIAIVLDLLDGRAARALRATSEFGRQLDSFSDACSFGVAPALLVYMALLRDLGWVGILVAVIYMLAGMFRLARHNMLSDAHAKATRTMGMPIPIAASYLMAITLMRTEMAPIVAAAVVMLMAFFMATRWKLPELKGMGPVTFLMVIGIINYLVFVSLPNWYTFGWWTFWNLLIVGAARTEDRRHALEAPIEH